ncbi:MAG: cobalt ECF transporter T component CbiQ [Chloroflexi bacterium]|nr:cobalt ECF transporter T component CbiQ [Chloroflexota bacterium]
MRHSFLDRYSDRHSVIHRRHPGVKLVVTVIFVLAVNITPFLSWRPFLAYLLILAALAWLARVPPLYVLKRSLAVMPFVLMVALFLPFFKPGEPAVTVPLGAWSVSATYQGLAALLTVMARAWLSMISLVLLISTTRITALLSGMETLGMPRVMVMVLSFMYRYIFILTDEVLRLKQARESRDFGGTRLWKLRTLGNIIGSLFIRSYERGERVYAAMLSRGFDGSCRASGGTSLRPADTIFTLCLVAAILAVYLGTHYA